MELVAQKVCRYCKLPHPRVYGGKYPRHVCPDCIAARYAARLKKRSDAAPTYPERAVVYAEANGRCQECGIPCRWQKANRYDRSNDIAEIDHIVPVVAGGTGKRTNLRLLCKGCNRAKGTRS